MQVLLLKHLVDQAQDYGSAELSYYRTFLTFKSGRQHDVVSDMN